MGGVDAWKDDHGFGGADVLGQDGERLVVGDSEGQLRGGVGGHRRGDEDVDEDRVRAGLAW